MTPGGLTHHIWNMTNFFCEFINSMPIFFLLWSFIWLYFVLLCDVPLLWIIIHFGINHLLSILILLQVMMNAMKIPSKRSTLEKKLDKLILTLFSVLFCMCLLGAIGRSGYLPLYSPFHYALHHITFSCTYKL